MDFKEQLKKQLDFIRTSCKEYDAGNVNEAVRIATALRVIIHDTKRSTSILKNLNIKDSIRLLSTAVGAIGLMNIIDIQIDFEILSGCFVPKFDRAKIRNYILVEQWWEREAIFYREDIKKALSRKWLVLSAANKDGGAHAAELESIYKYLKAGAGSGMKLTIEGREINCDFLNAPLAALRQIGYEILNSPDIINITG